MRTEEVAGQSVVGTSSRRKCGDSNTGGDKGKNRFSHFFKPFSGLKKDIAAGARQPIRGPKSKTRFQLLSAFNNQRSAFNTTHTWSGMANQRWRQGGGRRLG